MARRSRRSPIARRSWRGSARRWRRCKAGKGSGWRRGETKPRRHMKRQCGAGGRADRAARGHAPAPGRARGRFITHIRFTPQGRKAAEPCVTFHTRPRPAAGAVDGGQRATVAAEVGGEAAGAVEGGGIGPAAQAGRALHGHADRGRSLRMGAGQRQRQHESALPFRRPAVGAGAYGNGGEGEQGRERIRFHPPGWIRRNPTFQVAWRKRSGRYMLLMWRMLPSGSFSHTSRAPSATWTLPSRRPMSG